MPCKCLCVCVCVCTSPTVMLVSICMPVCTCVERRGGWVVIVTVTSHPEFSRKYTTDTDSGVKGAVQQKRKEKEDRYRTI
ncbi:hypothetical protein B0T09DRAFT_336182, partial [Sordaria sp. MPI-SDFR-AT-0083]